MRHHEDQIQIACVAWFRMQYPALESHFFSYPIDGHHKKKLVKTKFGTRLIDTEGARKKKMGAKSGISDLLLLVPNENYHWLAIEMKSATGRQSENQKEWQKNIEKLSFGKYVVCKSTEEFISEINAYLEGTPFGRKNF